MPNERLTFQLRGSADENGDVRFDDFIRELAAIKKSLADMDRLAGNEGKVYYRVVDLHHSLATLELQAFPVEPAAIGFEAGMELLYQSVDAIQKDEAPPLKLDYMALQSLKELTTVLGSRMPEVLVKRDGQTVSVSSRLAKQVDQILGPYQYEIGSFVGHLEQINLHDAYKFTLYPVNRGSSLTCQFPRHMKRDAIEALDHYVRVYGKFRYYVNYPQPIDIRVQEIEIMPDESEIPSITELRGAAPDAMGNLSSEEFVRRVRDGW